MTPLERLYAEELPTGTFGGRRPGQPAPAEERPAYTPEQQATNLAALTAAVGPKPKRRRHLTAVPAAA